MAPILSLIAAAVAMQQGILMGHVFVGPLTPVERVGQPQTVSPSWYRPLVVLIYRGDKMKMSFAAKRVKVNDRGDFKTHLTPGLYWVQLARDDNRASFRPLPRVQVAIRADQISRVNLSVDTGIR